jgi:hypothetical protein
MEVSMTDIKEIDDKSDQLLDPDIFDEVCVAAAKSKLVIAGPVHACGSSSFSYRYFHIEAGHKHGPIPVAIKWSPDWKDAIAVKDCFIDRLRQRMPEIVVHVVRDPTDAESAAEFEKWATMTEEEKDALFDAEHEANGDDEDGLYRIWQHYRSQTKGH